MINVIKRLSDFLFSKEKDEKEYNFPGDYKYMEYERKEVITFLHADNMMSNTIHQKNAVIRFGDSGKFKVADGKTKLRDLPYSNTLPRECEYGDKKYVFRRCDSYEKALDVQRKTKHLLRINEILRFNDTGKFIVGDGESVLEDIPFSSTIPISIDFYL